MQWLLSFRSVHTIQCICNGIKALEALPVQCSHFNDHQLLLPVQHVQSIFFFDIFSQKYKQVSKTGGACSSQTFITLKNFGMWSHHYSTSEVLSFFAHLFNFLIGLTKNNQSQKLNKNWLGFYQGMILFSTLTNVSGKSLLCT